jgi:hypothetical protein
MELNNHYEKLDNFDAIFLEQSSNLQDELIYWNIKLSCHDTLDY